MMLLFILLFFQPPLAHLVWATTVPGCYRDRDKDHRPRQNCTAAGFTSIPTGIEPSTKVLLFTGNLFSSLSWSSFQNFDEIYEIDLSFNQVPEVVPTFGPILPTLFVLRLSSNLLTSLPDQSFSACPALTELHLNNNSIQSLSDQTFAGLSKLEILDLSSNLISVLPALMLHPLPAIETLYMEFNKIAEMPNDWFSKKEEVPYLFLSANPWACSCSLGYFHRYLGDYELNVYVRDGPIITVDAESVVCVSPPRLRDQAIVNLEESDLCPEDVDASEQEVTFSPPRPPRPPTTTITPFITSITPPLPTTTITPPTTPPLPTTTITPPTTPPPPTPTITPPTTPMTPPATLTVTPLPPPTTIRYWLNPSAFHIESTKHQRVESTTGPHVVTTTFAPEPATSTTASTTWVPWVVTSPSPTMSTPVIPSTEPSPTTIHLAIATTSVSRATVFPVTFGGVGRKHVGTMNVQAAALFCLWLFAACLLLCVASAASIVATALKLTSWYRQVYKPLKVAVKKRLRDGEEMRLLSCKATGEREVKGGAGGAVMALYRSVLFIHREDNQRVEEAGEVNRIGGGGGEKERVLVSLEPAGGEGLRREEKEGGVERGVYRKTLYRLVSKDKVTTRWTDVTEESWVPANGAGRKGGRGGEVPKKRYSVILREETGEEPQRQQEREWVVGGWEVKGGGVQGEGNVEEEQRSSWGQWLVQFLPSMPWGVTSPSGGRGSWETPEDQFHQ